MTIGRKVKCQNADCPHEKLLGFSDWVRDNLPDSKSGFFVTDIDFIFINERKKKFILLETKTNNAIIKQWQKNILKNICIWLMRGIFGYKYKFYCIIFENYTPCDGKIYLYKKDNKEEITENYLKELLS